MARLACLICQHPQIAEINTALATPGISQRNVAASYGIGQTAIWRHANRCVMPAVRKSLERQELITGASLIAGVVKKQHIVDQSLQECASLKQFKDIAPLANSSLKHVEVLARLSGVEGYKQVQSAPIAIDARGSRFLIMPVPTQAQEQLALTGDE